MPFILGASSSYDLGMNWLERRLGKASGHLWLVLEAEMPQSWASFPEDRGRAKVTIKSLSMCSSLCSEMQSILGMRNAKKSTIPDL